MEKTGEDNAELEDNKIMNSSEGENDQNSGDHLPESEHKLSKRKIRKLKKKENALKYRHEKRLRERENKKKRKRELKEKGEGLGPSKKMLKRNTMANSSCKIKVAIDCSFDELMVERDIMKLTQQLSYAYSANRRAENPLQLYVTSLGGKTKERMDRIGDYVNWDVYFKDEEYCKVFDKESIVYLTSDSENVLQSIEPDKVYIIGGLVDHNSQKGLCHKLAVDKGIKHAQLPIGQYIEIKTRKVLTVNHVFEILLSFTECQDWEEAFFKVLPQRKGATFKRSKPTKQTDNNSNLAERATQFEEGSQESRSCIEDKTESTEVVKSETTVISSECADTQVKETTDSSGTSEDGFS